MDNIRLERKERIRMFLNEYYVGGSTLVTIIRIIGGPFILYLGLDLYVNASGRFGIGYGGILVAFSVYYTLKPFLWVLIKWTYYKTIEFQIAATPDKLIIKEDGSESQTEYSKFEKIIKRKNYFALRIRKGLKIYLPINKLSEQTVATLTEKVKQ